MKVTNHRDLIVYQKAVELQQAVFETSKTFPREEMYALTDQCRRSSRLIGANIAEAWRKRRYEAHFVSKLTDADGENAATEHWLDAALKCEHILSRIDVFGIPRQCDFRDAAVPDLQCPVW